MKRRDFFKLAPLAAAIPAIAKPTPSPRAILTMDGSEVARLDVTGDVIIELDGRAITEAVVEHLPGVIRRHGLG